MGDRVNYILGVYRKYAAFDGRARRTEYWTFTGFFILVLTLGSLLSELGPGTGIDIIATIILAIFTIASFVPAVGVRIRRLHDSNRTGYWILLSFIPFIGSIVLLVFDLMPGTKGANQYGQDPRTPGEDISQVFA